MTTNIGFLKVTLIAILFILSDNGLAQNELRDAFFKDADIAKATAEAANAKLFAPNISVCRVSPTIPILDKGMCLPDNSLILFIASSKIVGKGLPNQNGR